MLPVESPFKLFTDEDGQPLDGGYVYFGEPNLNPITHPIEVFWDAAGTIPAEQPMRTVNGYIYRSGTPTNVFTNSAYSELVMDKKGRQVFFARTSDEFSIATTVLNFISGLTASAGASLVGFLQAGFGALTRTVQDKLRDTIDAADFIAAPGASEAADKAGVQKAINEMAARGGGIVRVRKPIGNWNLDDIEHAPTVMLEDDRYSDSGWKFWHSDGDDAQIGLRGRATANGEGPCVVMQNIASTGNRNVSFVHWYGPSHAPVVASFEHWGYMADGSWYGGREWLSRGSDDTGSRARYRLGNDGSIVFNPNGDANSFKNNPAVGFDQNYIYVFNTPLLTGYADSGKYLMGLKTTALELAVELHINAAQPAIRMRSAAGVERYSIIGDFPSSGQLTVYDNEADEAMATFTSGGALAIGMTGVTFAPAAAADVANSSLFLDTADGKLKFKDAGGTVTPLY